MKNYFLGRLKEPSTWRAIIWLATSFGIYFNPDQASAIVALGSILAGGVGVAVPDKLFRDGGNDPCERE